MNKTYIAIGGIAVVVVLLYLYSKNNTAGATAVGATPLPLGAGGTISPGGPNAQGSPVVSTTINPITQQSSNTWLAANGSVEVPSAVQQWVGTLPPNNQARFMQQLPKMSGSDINGLFDIIINAWGKGAQPTAAQVNFWNTWRTQYGILDGTVNNFTGKPKFNQYGKRV